MLYNHALYLTTFVFKRIQLELYLKKRLTVIFLPFALKVKLELTKSNYYEVGTFLITF